MSNLKVSAAQLYPDFPWVPPPPRPEDRTNDLQASKGFLQGGFPKEYLVTDWSVIYIEPETIIDVTQYNSKNLTLGHFNNLALALERFISKSSFPEVASVCTQRHYSSQTANRWWIFLFFWSLLCLEHWPKRGAGLGRSQTVSSFLFQRAI